MHKQTINIVWFKRDLRLSDHEPLATAIRDGLPTLLLYCFEPSLMSDVHSATRHWRFVYESLEDMNHALAPYDAYLHIWQGEAVEVFSQILDYYVVKKVYSHLEVGLQITMQRNADISQLLRGRGVEWIEYSQEGIIPNQQNRVGWEENWYHYMRSSLDDPDIADLDTLRLPASFWQMPDLPIDITTPRLEFQPGGTYYAQQELDSFLKERGRHYIHSLSDPTKGQWAGSRLSPYLAYGCLSVREVYQAAARIADRSFVGNNYRQYLIRLFWRSHYMQKLETEWELEFEPTNRALGDIIRPYDEELFEAWAEGKTGFPIIDAAMRCLIETGFVNFRMRATLVTFATYTLWQDWKRVAEHLARLFLDFEPGLHYGQIHMQAGLTGYHTLRVFNPTAQFEKHDKSAEFVREWLPELRKIPLPTIYQPWLMTQKEQQWYGCKIGVDYPDVIVDYDIATRIARKHYWKLRQRLEVYDELPGIWQRHCLPKNIAAYERTMYINLQALKYRVWREV